MTEHETLQQMARKYLKRLFKEAKKIGMGEQIDKLIKDNEQGRCVADKEQVDKLARILDEDRIKYYDIPEKLGMSKRKLEDDGLRKSIRKLDEQGQFSKTDTILLKEKMKGENK